MIDCSRFPRSYITPKPNLLPVEPNLYNDDTFPKSPDSRTERSKRGVTAVNQDCNSRQTSDQNLIKRASSIEYTACHGPVLDKAGARTFIEVRA